MKRTALLLALVLFLLPQFALAGGRIVLLSCYEQSGWDDLTEIGFIDEDGLAYHLYSGDRPEGFPSDALGQLSYLQEHLPEPSGRVGGRDMNSLLSLIGEADPSGITESPAGDDAGVHASWAFRYSSSGEPQAILLGKSGDTFARSPSLSNQSLYTWLHEFFPGITDYSYTEDFECPGFTPVPLTDFCHLGDLDPASPSCSIVMIQTGATGGQTREENPGKAREFLSTAVILAKAGSLIPEADTEYVLTGKDGTEARLRFAGSLLIREDGTYQCIRSDSLSDPDEP